MQTLRKIFTLFFVLCFVSFANFVKAENPLTLEDCIQQAELNNPDLAAAKENVRIAQANLKGSYSDFIPKISADVSYSASNTTVVNGSNINSTNRGTQEQLGVGPGVRENLFSGFRTVGTIKKNKAELKAAEANLAQVKTQVSYSLKTSFYKLLFAQEQLKLTESIVPRREQNLKLVDLRFQVGRENKGSVLRSEAQFKQAQYDVLQSKQNLKVAVTDLARVLGNAEQEAIVVKGDFKIASLPPLPDFVVLAKNTPLYHEAQATVDSAKASVTIVKSDLYPSLDTSASFSRTRNDWDSDVNRWSAGVNLSYPFFNGGKTFFDIQASKSNARKSEYNSKSTYNQILADLKKTYADFNNAIQFSQVQKSFLQASLVRAEIARSQYANGLVSFQDWDSIETDLINAQKSTLSSLNNAVIAAAAWEQAQGKGVLK